MRIYSINFPPISVTLPNATLNLTYRVDFSAFEHFLATNGLVFNERIRIVGEDPGTATDITLGYFPINGIPIPAGAGPITITRNRSFTLLRSSLQEDPGLGDNDEISLEIQIIPVGMPAISTAKTNIQTILG